MHPELKPRAGRENPGERRSNPFKSVQIHLKAVQIRSNPVGDRSNPGKIRSNPFAPKWPETESRQAAAHGCSLLFLWCFLLDFRCCFWLQFGFSCVVQDSVWIQFGFSFVSQDSVRLQFSFGVEPLAVFLVAEFMLLPSFHYLHGHPASE